MTSVLDQMTAGVTARKADKAAQLTPVGGERLGRSRIPDVPEVFLTGEALTDIAKDLRRQAEVLIAVADGLDGHVGRTPIDTAEKINPAVQIAQEQAADAKFAERFQAMQAEAQAATFVAADAPVESVAAASGSAAAGWVCPVHGDADIKELTSKRTKRQYRACAICSQFEK